jgi:hypothetical protein
VYSVNSSPIKTLSPLSPLRNHFHNEELPKVYLSLLDNLKKDFRMKTIDLKHTMSFKLNKEAEEHVKNFADSKRVI